MFKALEVAIKHGGKVRTWWLTRRLGIVRFDYDISTVDQVAVLKDSDLLAIYRPEHQTRTAGGISANKPYRRAAVNGTSLEIRCNVKGNVEYV